MNVNASDYELNGLNGNGNGIRDMNIDENSDSDSENSNSNSNSKGSDDEDACVFYENAYKGDMFDYDYDAKVSANGNGNGNGNGNPNGNANGSKIRSNNINGAKYGTTHGKESKSLELTSPTSTIPPGTANGDADNNDNNSRNNNQEVSTVPMNYDIGISTHEADNIVCCRWFRRCCCTWNCCCYKSNSKHQNKNNDPNADIYISNGNDNSGLEETPSNEELLSIAFISFLAFTTSQAVAAFLAKSDAMKGDSIAMGVDCFTYGFNLVAEKLKNRADQAHLRNAQFHNDDDDTRRKKERAKRKFKLILELVPPLVSVSTLIVVTIVILRKSITTLILDSTRDKSLQSEPNVVVMFAFSFLNLFVDLMNVVFFAKADHALGFDIVDEDEEGGEDADVDDDNNDNSSNTNTNNKNNGTKKKNRIGKNIAQLHREHNRKKGGAYATIHHGDDEPNCSDDDCPGHGNANNFLKFSIDSDDDDDNNGNDNDNDDRNTDSNTNSVNNSNIISNTNGRRGQFDKRNKDEEEFHHHDHHKKEKANLNMCSAYTHVFADTVRSFAVLIAAVLAQFVDNISPEEADASAAVAVSVIILCALLPLFAGLRQTWNELRAIRKEELSEKVIKFHPSIDGTLA